MNQVWNYGLPVPKEYLGIIDLQFYYFAWVFGYYVDYIGITPNMITLFGFFCNCITGYSILYDKQWFFITLFLATVADTMDGYNARRFNKKSKFGALIDHGTDWMSATIIITCSVYRWYQYISFYCIFAILIYLEKQNIVYSGFIQEYNGSRDLLISAAFQYEAGQNIHSMLIKYKEYNSSTLTFVIMFSLWAMQTITYYF